MFSRRLLYEKLLAFLKCKKWFEPHWEVIWSVCRIYQATNTVTLKRASEEQTCCVQHCRYVRTCMYVGGWDLRDNHLTKKIRARPSCVPPSSRVLFVLKVFFRKKKILACFIPCSARCEIDSTCQIWPYVCARLSLVPHHHINVPF